MFLGYVENKANLVQLQLQLPTGTELGKKHQKNYLCILDEGEDLTQRLISASLVVSLVTLFRKRVQWTLSSNNVTCLHIRYLS